MKTKLRSFFSLLALLVIISSCEKEMSVENGTGTSSSSGTSVYTFVGATGSCTAALIGGTYKVNVPATASNTVTLQVNVTVIGTYTVATPLIDGLTFTASGTFTTTGLQTIVFVAAGTPIVRGTFPYSPGFNGCSFSIPIAGATTSTTPATYTLQGAAGACTAPTIGGTYAATQPLTAANTVSLTAIVTVAGAYTITTNATNGITFSTSGTFATTGAQQIILKGSGTPTAAGTDSFTPQITGACAFQVTTAVAPPVAAGTLTCKVNGVLTTFNFEATASQVVTPASPPAPATVDLEIHGQASGSSNENFSIDLEKTGTTINNEVFDQAGATSGKIYIIDYTDVNGTDFNAVTGVTVTPFTVTITSITATRVQGTFSGTVSDSGTTGGNTKTITEGSFNVPIQ